MKLLFNRWFYVLQDEKGEGEGGGGSGGDAGKKAEGDANSKLDAALKRADALEARLAALEGKGKNSNDGKDDDLAEKARKEREASDKAGQNQKQLESALSFSLKSKDWLKDNAPLLPKTIPGIFEAASKENYSNAIEKDNAIKCGIVSEFFAVQENVDLLTASQRSALEDFNKLTKNVKQERAQLIYDTLFEPTFEMLKRVKKAEQLRKGVVEPSDAEAAYKAKMIGISRKHYLGEKQNGA